MEKSQAIKCPDIFTQLINLKYFQYYINKEETWTHFGFSKETFKKHRRSFCDILTIKDFNNSKEEMLKYISENGGFECFVLKPQREGGANNYFCKDILLKINESSLKELEQFILMGRIFSTKRLGLFSDFHNIFYTVILSEIGFYCWSLSENGNIIESKMADYLVRSKKLGVDEGGICSGFAFLDTFSIIE